MDEFAEIVPQAKGHKKKWWLALVLLGIFCVWFGYQLFGPNEAIRVSRETTFITEPLTPEGLPDYAAYLLNNGREGVTSENNGAIPFWQAIGLRDLDPAQQASLCSALGMEIPGNSQFLSPPYAERMAVAKWFAEKHGAIAHEYSTEAEEEGDRELIRTLKDTVAEEIYGQVMDHPWKSAQVPPMAEWVERNQVPLDLLVEASLKEKFWSPPPWTVDNEPTVTDMFCLAETNGMRVAARSLSCRVMWHVGEERPEEAWRDCFAMFRLASFYGKSPLLGEQLVAIAHEGMAHSELRILLHHGEPDAKLARQILAQITELGPATDFAKAYDLGERMLFLENAMQIATNRESFGGISSLGNGTASPFLADFLRQMKVDWNDVLTTGNELFDQAVVLFREPDNKTRQAELSRLDENLLSAENTGTSWKMLTGISSRKARNRILSTYLAGELFPAFKSLAQIQVREWTDHQLTQIAAALAVYRAENGVYPETLDVMVPGILTEMPLDLYSNKPFFFAKESDGGYLLYSVFENGEDDQGLDYGGRIVDGEWVSPDNVLEIDMDHRKSDLVIRMPVPSFKLPEWPEGLGTPASAPDE